ncbi:putative ribonuclease H-like domain-containing protein [Tanacetum coccineum]|uniref:Ribonuclease H-like domain-containing protein n=1 Tax=Tanacetum coccineum TaxID=301880 RepID=A0ABQ5GI86_9ASTR
MLQMLNHSWAAIKSRFGGNDESKKMQRNVLKHQFENFTTAPNESLDKAYDRFQKLISQLEVHAAPVSKEDINQKFLRSLPPSWSQIALIMRNKPDIDQTDIDDLYNNLRVYEDEMKRSSSSTSNSQNLAFLSSENTSSTNEVSTASGNFGVNTAGGTSSSSQVSSTPGADEVVCSFFAQQTTSPPLDNEDLQQIDQDDLEELDIRWQVAMLTVRVQRFIQKTGRNLDFKGKQPVTFDKSKVECYNCHRKGHFAKECKSGRNQGKRSYGDNGRRNATTNEPSSQALVAQDGLGGYDWSNDFDEPVNYALMAISSSSSSSSSDNEVQNCSKQCLESFKTLQKNFDSEREKHSRARLEIQGYELALESLESRILRHEKNELAWGEKYEFQNYELKCREIKINNLKMELEKVVKERDELKVKIEKWEESSKGLNKLLNSQMSAKDKNGLGYGTQLDEMSNKSETDSEISMSVFEVRSSDEEITPANDRFSKVDGYHAVPPPITGNFLTPRADISFAGLDEYAIRKKIIKSKTTELNTDTSKSKTSETIGKTNEVNIEKPKSVHESIMPKPKINRDKVVIEDWYSDDEDDVSEVNTVSPVKTNETQTVKTQVDKIGQISQKGGIGFKKIKACFVCKSTDHLIKDCDLYAKKSPEPKLKTVVNTGQREGKPVWDNTKRVNHQNFSKYPHLSKTFVPSGVLTRTGLHRPSVSTARPSVSTARPVCTARPSVSTARPVCTARPSVSTARPVCTARPSVSTARPVYATRPIYPRMDNVRPRGSCSPIKRSYYTKPAFRPKDLKQDVKTFGVQNMTTAGTRAVVNTGKGKLDTDLKKSRWVWRPKGNYLDHVSKDSGSFMLKKGNPEILLQDHAVVDSGYSSHMTGNKAYHSDYEDFNRGFVAFENELNFKLLDESQVVLRAPRKDDVYSLDLKNIVHSGGLENQLSHNVKMIRCDNGTEFKNHAMNELCAKKGIKREFSVVRTPQQNGVAEKKNRTLIEAARTMLADSLLPILFWADAVNTACYVLNRILVIKPQNKTPCELLICKSPSISFMRPFGCPLTILNTLDSLGKFDGKSDEGYLLGYSTSSKAFRVYNKRTKRVRENLHINFLEDQPNVTGTGTQDSYVAGSSGKDKGPTQEYILFPLQPYKTSIPIEDVAPAAHEKPSESSPKDNDVQDSEDVANKESEQDLQDELEKMVTQELATKAMDDVSRQAFEEEKRRIASQKKAAQATSTNKLSTDRPSVSTDRPSVSTDRPSVSTDMPFVSTDRSNTPYVMMEYSMKLMMMMKMWVQWLISTTWITPLLNKKDERSIVVKNKAWLVAQGFRQEEGIDYDEIFAPVARIEAIRLFLTFASYMGFTVYQMDVKSEFLYGTIEEEVYVHQPLSFIDPAHPNKVYKDKYVADILKKFDFLSIRTNTTPIESNKPLVKDEDGVDVDVHIYRSMIGSLMYLTASRPDIMFAVCAWARFQVTPKASHLNAVKRIFRYLKHQPKLCLRYPRDSPFKLEAYSDSDYGGASLDRKSATGGCQFLGRRLIYWQCKKHTIMANSTTEAEYVAAANYFGQVL